MPPATPHDPAPVERAPHAGPIGRPAAAPPPTTNDVPTNPLPRRRSAPPAPTSPPAPVPPRAPAPRGVVVELTTIRTGTTALRRTLEVNARHVVGRDPERAQIAFPHDARMSAAHYALVLERSRVLVRDLDSANGTHVNGIPIGAAHRLEDGDVIRAGETEIRVRFPSGLDLRPARG